MFTPKIIALDLDGTLLSSTGTVTPFTKEQILLAAGKGIVTVISTGRPFAGIPFQIAAELGIEYAITANGAGIYQIADKKCLYEDGISAQRAAEICTALRRLHLHMDVFINGDAYTQCLTFDIIRKSRILPESVKKYILSTRYQVKDLSSYILENNLALQKATLTFEQDENGTFVDREAARKLLLSRSDLNVVCGGYYNLEFTKANVSKGAGLRFLCDYLNIPPESSMVCGDSENDLDILKAAGLSVAMENAPEQIKSVCDFVTASCNDDGVGHAIAKFIGAA